MARQVIPRVTMLTFGLFFVACAHNPTPQSSPTDSYRILHQNILINSDLWTDQPEILSANYAFDNIIGVAGGESEVRAAGGTWNSVTCPDAPRRALTSSAQPTEVAFSFGYSVQFADALPVVFSWPLLPESLGAKDFLLTLNTGQKVHPEVASIFPNFEYNERHVAVIFGQFGNRLSPGTPGAIFPTQVEIVNDGTPLQLLGPAGPVSAVGRFKEITAHPYLVGPSLVSAKLSRLLGLGEAAPLPFSSQLPNDGVTLYGSGSTQPSRLFRLRLFTSGGFSPDGVRGVHPDEFGRFFQIYAQEASGGTVQLTQTGIDYAVAGGTIRIMGLADLGPLRTVYDDCYLEDYDNYIDIILSGDEPAMRSITQVEIPARNGYSPFFNPGGPGNSPTSGVIYTAPGAADLQPVTLALDDPKTVSYGPRP